MSSAYHTYSVSRVFGHLTSQPSGLTHDEAARRLAKYGLNSVPEKKRYTIALLLFRQCKNPLTILLILATLLSYYLGDFAEAVILMVVIVSDISIGFYQEYKATKSIASLLTFLTPQALVLRSGERVTTDSKNLVPGDVVLVTAGDKVPADLRLVQAYDLAVDESLLTGESIPVDKITQHLFDMDLPVADQTNMAFSGSVVVRGNGRGIVVATGQHTILGTIAAETSATNNQETPLTKQFEIFSRKIGVFVAVAAVLVFVLGLGTGYPLEEIFKEVVAVSVAAIPEGLPLVVTAALAFTVQKMAKKKIIIRQLPAAETLGSCTVICTDKTGTLTKNEMTVKKLFDGTSVYDVSGDGYSVKGSIYLNGSNLDKTIPENLRMLLTVGLLCNESGISVAQDDINVHGDPTEIAIILAAYKAGLLKEEERRHYSKIAVLPFDSKRGYMATLHKKDGTRVVFVKGAPEKIAQLCKGDVHDIESHTSKLAGDGLRVLAFAYKEVKDLDTLTENDVKGDLQFLGLSAMIDPPREGVKEAVASCHEAGIRVIMVTGDHAVTAGAIAKQLGISKDARSVVTGYELSRMSDADLKNTIYDVNVFARISPEQKLRIVSILKAAGEIVAVTGDGVNDAPALKVAHLGVAMGRGSDVAKEVSDMVIVDDNFATIVKAIEEARILFANIRNATMFLLPTGLAAILTVFATMILRLPAPYTAIQLLWINLVTSGLQDVALAFEPGEKGILRKKPRKQTFGIMSPLLYERTLLVAGTIAIGVLLVYLTSLRLGMTVSTAQTLATTTMVFFQFFQVWNSRSETLSIFHMKLLGNPMLFVTMVLALVAQAGALFFAPLRILLSTTTLGSSAILWSLSVASSIFLVVEVDKLWRRKRLQHAKI